MRHRSLFLIILFLIASLNSFCLYRYVKGAAATVVIRSEIPAQLLRTGDIVLRRGKGVVSHWFAQMSQQDPFFSHAGIILRTGDEVCVISSTQDCTCPGLISQGINEFLSSEITEAYAIYRYPLDYTASKALERTLSDDIHHSVPFDSDFDLGSDSAYYCTEYIYKRMSRLIPGQLSNISSTGNWKYVAPEDLYLYANGRFIIPRKYLN